MKHRQVALSCVAGVLFAISCGSSSSDAPAEDYTGSCNILASQCHPYKTGLGHECHELGHGGDDKACGPRKAECQAACPLVEASTPQDGSTPDVDPGDGSALDGDAAADPLCTSYCKCLTDTCSTQTGYPFAAAGSCAAKCASMSAAERKCWPNWCEQAKAGGAAKEHLCEHAWGALDLDECPP